MIYNLTTEKSINLDFAKDTKLIFEIAQKIIFALSQDIQAIALAAPQIGFNYNLFVSNHREILDVIINPVIIYKSHTQVNLVEGCRSLPNEQYTTNRAKSILVKYYTLKGRKKYKKFQGLASCIVQHEIDHLQGKMINDFRKLSF